MALSNRPSALVCWLLISIVLCVGATACAGSAGAPIESVSRAATAPVPTTQGLLPPDTPTTTANAEATVPTPPASPNTPAERADDSQLSDDETVLLAQWQENQTYERDLRNAEALVGVMFESDGSLVANQDFLAGYLAYAADDPELQERIDVIEAEAGGESPADDAFALALATGTFPDLAERQWPLDEAPQGDELRQLVADGNQRLDPLKPTFFRLVHAAIALASGQINAPEGTSASLLVEELASEAEAVYGPILADSVAQLRQAIPAGSAFDSPEARRSFGQFAGELVDRVGRPALGE